ncbi:tetratricopeptide repeat protein [Marinigracilibium pacificum]|uniref:Tetratricopeptide repeat protein n=1 Tax=Marinigracilibium pacificum TaxID=2729599 RepID=A0A848J8B8_9BACT|nr:tetratricopeptide repeat protein [Marinigracilibium pacificum]NMM49312.1 hypothetical protein [Marinigracilibium pacificum]
MVSKQDLFNYFNNPENVSSEQLTEIQELSDSYPYYQALHMLIAKVKQHQEADDAQDYLHKAAIYTNDRDVLKQYMESSSNIEETEEVENNNEFSDSDEDSIEEAQIVVENNVEEETTNIVETSDEEEETESTTDETYEVENNDLEEEEESEESSTTDEESDDESSWTSGYSYSTTSEEEENENDEQISESNHIVEEPEKEEEEPENDIYSELMANLASLKETMGESDTKETKADDDTEEVEKKKLTTSEADIQKDDSDTEIEKTESEEKQKGSILESLKKKAEASPSSQNKGKKDRQKDIIDSFISNSPSLDRFKTDEPDDVKDENVKDLSKESTSINENLVSETLANIYAKQGKTQKAIEIYKKLIWKYPQKKAYFASQISKLEN